eukprot:Hpha_TRINITY_DN16534_c0_g1::TRINITY_DN16534_c0_g1_i1::g.133546::m.133546
MSTLARRETTCSVWGVAHSEIESTSESVDLRKRSEIPSETIAAEITAVRFGLERGEVERSERGEPGLRSDPPQRGEMSEREHESRSGKNAFSEHIERGECIISEDFGDAIKSGDLGVHISSCSRGKAGNSAPVPRMAGNADIDSRRYLTSQKAPIKYRNC